MGIALIFMLGTVIGSFLNVCIYRMPRGMSIIVPSSHCPMCKDKIPPHDNIPILSFIFLGGKCRSCRASIPLRYPVVETFTGLMFVFVYLMYGIMSPFLAYSVLVSLLIVATFIDLDFQVIPDHVTVTGLVAGFAFSWLTPSLLGQSSRWMGLGLSVAGACVGAGLIYLLRFFGKIAFRKKLESIGEKEAMGEGDIFLMAMIGAFLGWKMVLFTFFLAPFFGAIVGLMEKMRRGKDMIPYGPYISIAAVIAIFFGEKILNILFYGL
jgi:leader peptidase (prepilin peptidase)/N-methyltransferase